MIDYIAFSKYCATCHFWTGERRPDHDEGRVYVPRHATIGTCDCPHGHWRGRLKPGESNCPHFQTWDEVKQHTLEAYKAKVAAEQASRFPR